MAQILVVYYSRSGSTAELARQACRGIESVAGASATLRTVPAVSASSEATPKIVPDQGPPYATLEELRRADALMLGSPTRFGNMAAPLKYFLDCHLGAVAGWRTGRQARRGVHRQPEHAWRPGEHAAVDDAAAAAPWHVPGGPALQRARSEPPTRGGGTPYGASHVAGVQQELTEDERTLAQALGRRVAQLAVTST
jgi:NAD(P)H dehydrogenase (quinone)